MARKPNELETDQAVANTVQLAQQLSKIICDSLEQNKCISYYKLHAEIEAAVKTKAMLLARGNIAAAARIICMKRTTFVESLKLKGIYKVVPAID